MDSLSRLPEIYAIQSMIEDSEWGKYFGSDLSNFLNWVDMPNELRQDLDHYRPDGSELHTPNDGKTEGIIQMLTEAGNATRQLPYHNIGHYQRAFWEASQAIREIEALAGTSFPEAVKQAFYVGVAGHDHEHTGSTYLQQGEESSSYRSVEGRSARAVDKLLEGWGYNPLARAFAAYTIWSSTFGGEKIGITVQPQGFFGLLMRAVDVIPSNDWVTSNHHDMQIMYGEKPANPPPTTIEKLIEDRMNFFQYIESTYSNLNQSTTAHLVSLFPEEKQGRLKKKLSQKSLTSRLNWNDRLEANKKAFKQATIEGTPERALFRSTLRHFGEDYRGVPDR